MPYLFRVSRLRRLSVLLRGTRVIVHRRVHRLSCLYLLQRFEGTYFRNSKICRDQGLMARLVQSVIVLFGNFLRSFEWGFHKVVSADIFLFFPKDRRRFRSCQTVYGVVSYERKNLFRSLFRRSTVNKSRTILVRFARFAETKRMITHLKSSRAGLWSLDRGEFELRLVDPKSANP